MPLRIRSGPRRPTLAHRGAQDAANAIEAKEKGGAIGAKLASAGSAAKTGLRGAARSAVAVSKGR